MDNIDELSIEIQSNSTAAVQGIDSLIGSLQGIKSIANSVSKGNEKIASSFRSIRESVTGINTSGITELQNQLRSLSGTKDENSVFLQMKENAKAFRTAINSIDKTADKLPSVMKKIRELDSKEFTAKLNEISKGLAPFNNAILTSQNYLKSFVDMANKLPTGIGKTVTALNRVNTVGGMSGRRTSLGGVDLLSNIYMIRRIGEVMGTFISKSNAYIENMNLFTVALGTYSERALSFIEQLEPLGVDPAESTRMLGMFYQLSTAMGMVDKNAYTLSEQFTKLTYDLSSFYNISVEQSFEKLQAAVTGMGKPIRQLGIDINEARLSEVALSLGIQESVRNMTQAEKTELRFVAIMQQASNALNDMERTILTPANALRILKAQLNVAAREIGNVFLPALTSILPYAIAVTKIIGEMVRNLAMLVGFEMPTIDTSDLTSAGMAMEDMSTNMNDTANAAKKLKTNLLGIDELNVLSPDTGAGGMEDIVLGGGSLGIDLEKFGYESIIKGINSQVDELVEKLKPAVEWAMKLLGAFLLFKGIGSGLAFLAGLKNSIATLLGLGAVAGKVGLLAKAFQWVASAASVMFTAITGGEGILMGLSAIFGTTISAGALALVAAGLVAVGLAAYGIYEGLQPSIEAANLFKYGLDGVVSSLTKAKVEPFIEDWKKLDNTLTSFDWTNKVITDDDIANVQKQLNGLTQTIVDELDADKNKELATIDPLKNVLSEEEFQNLYDKNTAFYDGLMTSTRDGSARITEILQKASDENRSISETEKAEINKIKEDMKVNGITVLSETERESRLIMQRMKDDAVAISLEQASEILKSSALTRDETIKNAEDQYYGILDSAERMRDLGIINEEEYQKMIDAAKLAKDETILAANEQYEGVLKAATDRLPELERNIDITNGNIKTNFQVLWSDITTNMANFGESWKTGWQTLSDNVGTWAEETSVTFTGWVDQMSKDFAVWSGEFSKDFWTTFDGLKNTVTTWTSDIMNAARDAFDSIRRWWEDLWDDLDEKGGSGKIDLGVGGRRSITPSPRMGFASGGILPDGTQFEMGERGKELIGTHQGKTTIMPLENTSFVSAIREAVQEGVEAAMVNQEGGELVAPVILNLDGSQVYENQLRVKNAKGYPIAG